MSRFGNKKKLLDNDLEEKTALEVPNKKEDHLIYKKNLDSLVTC